MSNLGVPTNDPVYIGVWTNWSQGKIFGSTLTLTQRDASFLIAFVALFISYAGTCFFRVTSFVLHIGLSSPTEDNDTLYHQRQAILRNSATGTDSLWSFAQLVWYWRGQGSHVVRRVAAFALHALLCVSIFAVAGIFSSRIANFNGDEVLVSSSKCGYLGTQNNVTIQEIYQIAKPYGAQRSSAFLDYVQNCYTANSTKPVCQSYVRSRLPYTVNWNATCPFEQSICRNTTNNIRLDSGYIDSHSDLGLNTPPASRIKLRQVLHCSPLTLNGHVQSMNFTRNGTNIPYRSYLYGSLIDAQTGRISANYSHLAQDVLAQQVVSEDQRGEQTSYGIGMSTYFGTKFPNADDHRESDFEPIHSLRRDDADLYTLHLYSRNVMYANPIDDPWFSAHEPLGTFGNDHGKAQVYKSDEAAPPIGCASQFELCLPNSNCSTLASTGDALLFAGKGGKYGDLPNWVAMASPLNGFDLRNIVGNIGGSFLLANYGLQGGIQYDLPDNHWQAEAERMFQLILASMQILFVDTATGPSNDAMEKFMTPPQSKDEKALCRNQKIRSTAYANFSIFGLGFTLGLGLLIILLNWTLERVYTKWFSNRRHSLPFAMTEWTLNGTLQLQRLAHQGVGYGTWSQCDKEVPTTQRHDTLAGLDLQDPSHPRLIALSTSYAQPKSASMFTSFGALEHADSDKSGYNGVRQHDDSVSSLNANARQGYAITPSMYSISPVSSPQDSHHPRYN